MKFRGQPIMSWTTPRSGVTIENPMYEWIQVARHFGYKYFSDEWQDLDRNEKAAYVAAYRLEQQSQAVMMKYR